MEKTVKTLTGICFLGLLASLLVFFRTKENTLAITFGTAFYHFAMRLSVGHAFQRRMANRANCSDPWYQPRAWEAQLYERLRVKQWKDKLPSYDPALFSPREHTWDEIAQAMCQAELVHETIVLLSFVPLLASIWFGAFPVFFITSLCAAGFDLLFVILQRYNRPRILRIAQKRK